MKKNYKNMQQIVVQTLLIVFQFLARYKIYCLQYFNLFNYSYASVWKRHWQAFINPKKSDQSLGYNFSVLLAFYNKKEIISSFLFDSKLVRYQEETKKWACHRFWLLIRQTASTLSLEQFQLSCHMCFKVKPHFVVTWMSRNSFS